MIRLSQATIQFSCDICQASMVRVSIDGLGSGVELSWPAEQPIPAGWERTWLPPPEKYQLSCSTCAESERMRKEADEKRSAEKVESCAAAAEKAASACAVLAERWREHGKKSHPSVREARIGFADAVRDLANIEGAIDE